MSARCFVLKRLQMKQTIEIEEKTDVYKFKTEEFIQVLYNIT